MTRSISRKLSINIYVSIILLEIRKLSSVVNAATNLSFRHEENIFQRNFISHRTSFHSSWICFYQCLTQSFLETMTISDKTKRPHLGGGPWITTRANLFPISVSDSFHNFINFSFHFVCFELLWLADQSDVDVFLCVVRLLDVWYVIKCRR